jgi:metal-responsive CopG/Arc/MetJ family transcriptional regulator
MAAGTVRTTITLPSDLIDKVDQIVQQGHARSRNELFLTALRHELAARERAAIDAEIALMANDPELIAEGLVLAEEAVKAGWEALQLSEREE